MATGIGNMNGTFKWIAGALLTVLLAAGGLVVDSVNSKVDTVKADSAQARTEIHAQVKENSAAINTMQQDVAVIKYQTAQILDILKQNERNDSTRAHR